MWFFWQCFSKPLYTGMIKMELGVCVWSTDRRRGGISAEGLVIHDELYTQQSRNEQDRDF